MRRVFSFFILTIFLFSHGELFSAQIPGFGVPMTAPGKEAGAAKTEKPKVEKAEPENERVIINIKPAAAKPEAKSEDSEDAPLWDRGAFDRIHLKTSKNRKTFDVFRLELPKGVPVVPAELAKAMKKAKLEIRLLEDPDNLREVSFQMLEKIELYEDMLIAEVRRLIAEKNFDDAYECLKFMFAEYPEMKSLKQTYQIFLQHEAADYMQRKNNEMALVRVRMLAELNPKYEKLPEIYVPLAETLVKESMAKKNYASAGRILTDIQKVLPSDPGVKKLTDDVNKQADKMKAAAQTALKNEDINGAIIASRAMLELSPKRADAVSLAKDIREKYPQVSVGVTWSANRFQPVALNDWASLRSRRLLYRPLVEFHGPGPEGGKYESPLGIMSRENLNRTLRLSIYGEAGWDGTAAKLTSYDVSRQFLASMNPADSQYDALFAETFQSVEAPSAGELILNLRRPHVLPESLLQMPVLPYTSGEEISPDSATNGPFVLKAINEKPVFLAAGMPKSPAGMAMGESQRIMRYVGSGNYFVDEANAGRAAKNRPLQIVETYYEKGKNAQQDLLANRIQILDRVNPWELEALRSEKNITVMPYAVPWTHVLLPNRDRPMMSNRTFRRALVYGMNREMILSHLLGGKPARGCQVISGPFSLGVAAGDPLSYAYDVQIAPRAYDPYLATALARVAVSQVMKPEEIRKIETERRAAKESAGDDMQDEDAPKKAPLLPMEPLVLAHPPHEPARIACQAIQSHLSVIGVPVTLYEFRPGEPAELRDDFDLLYAELTMSEPLLDARRLLGTQGPTRRSSSHMDLALRQLDAAMDWKEISRILKRIHRLAYDDTAVIPLWQIVEHFAYSNAVEGVGEKPISVYENVEEWRVK